MYVAKQYYILTTKSILWRKVHIYFLDYIWLGRKSASFPRETRKVFRFLSTPYTHPESQLEIQVFLFENIRGKDI